MNSFKNKVKLYIYLILGLPGEDIKLKSSLILNDM
jgi:hypothetical protein